MKLTPRPEVYSLFWYLACERMNIFYRRLAGVSQPFSSDEIFQNYKFTNAYRVLDRASQYLVSEVQDGDYCFGDQIFRTMLYKVFNLPSTWEILKEGIGEEPTSSNFDFDLYASVLTEAKNNGIKIFSGAYMTCGSKHRYGYHDKHLNFLACLKEVFFEMDFMSKMLDVKNMGDIYSLIVELPFFGYFLAMQVATDINYTDEFQFSESEFIVSGPGAWRGSRKIFVDVSNDIPVDDITKYLHDIQEKEFERLGLTFRSLGGRPLQLIDIQNCLCELDKYTRVSHPNLEGYGRKRIKTRFRANPTPIKYCLPHWWKIDYDEIGCNIADFFEDDAFYVPILISKSAFKVE